MTLRYKHQLLLAVARHNNSNNIARNNFKQSKTGHEPQSS